MEGGLGMESEGDDIMGLSHLPIGWIARLSFGAGAHDTTPPSEPQRQDRKRNRPEPSGEQLAAWNLTYRQ